MWSPVSLVKLEWLVLGLVTLSKIHID